MSNIQIERLLRERGQLKLGEIYVGTASTDTDDPYEIGTLIYNMRHNKGGPYKRRSVRYAGPAIDAKGSEVPGRGVVAAKLKRQR